MKRTLALILAVLIASTALILSPEAVVRGFLPDKYASYHDRLVLGLWLTRFCLLIDAVILGALPLIHRKLFWPRQPEREVESLPTFSRGDVFTIVMLTLLALSLRAYRLSSSYSADEISITMSMAERTLPQLMMRAEPYRLLPAMLAHFLYKLLGVSEISGRLPSLISGAASVPLLYILARRWYSARCASVAAAFLALSTFHLWYSQLMTSYAIALFFLLLSMLLFEDCLRHPRPRSWYWWGVSVFLAIVSHFQLALFVVLAQGLRLGWRVLAGRDGRLQFWRFSVIIACCLALAATMFAPNFFVWSSIITGLAGNSDPHLLMVEPRGTVPIQTVLLSQWLCNEYSPWFLQAVVGLAFIIGGVASGRRKPGLTLYLMLPTIVLWALFCVGVIRRITPRHSIFTLIPMSLFVGLTVADAIALTMRRRGQGWRAAAWAGLTLGLLVTLLWNALISLQQYDAVDRFPFKPVASFVKSRVRTGEPIFGMGYGYTEFGYYLPGTVRLEHTDDVAGILDRREPAWFIGLGQGFVRNMTPSLRERFLKETSLVYSHIGRPEHYLDLNDAFVYRYEPAPF